MPATASDLSAAIQPGSTEYGDRQVLEEGLAQVVPQQQGPSTAATSAPPPLDSTTDPLAAILQGKLDPGASGAITDGLSVGPGVTPNAAPQDPVLIRLRNIATTAKSPLVRAAARNEMRRRVREPV